MAAGMSTVAVATGFGGPEVLSLIDEPAPAPGPGEVRIEVRAAGVNPIDYKQYSGAFGEDPAKLPMRLGLEAAGIITAVGPDAHGASGPLAVGDEVVGYPLTGAYAAEVIAPAEVLLPKPEQLSWEDAGGLLLTGGTAAHCMVAADVHAGDTVLVHGGAGGVGLTAVQLAVARGATVIATASPRRHDVLRELGAVPVAYGDGLADRVRELAPDGVDAALDLVGTDEALDTSVELVQDRARIVTIAGFARAGELGITAIGGGPGADPGTEIRRAARAGLLADAASGELKVFIARTYPLDQVAEAHRESIAGHAAGKIVLIP